MSVADFTIRSLACYFTLSRLFADAGVKLRSFPAFKAAIGQQGASPGAEGLRKSDRANGTRHSSGSGALVGGVLPVPIRPDKPHG